MASCPRSTIKPFAAGLFQCVPGTLSRLVPEPTTSAVTSLPVGNSLTDHLTGLSCAARALSAMSPATRQKAARFRVNIVVLQWLAERGGDVFTRLFFLRQPRMPGARLRFWPSRLAIELRDEPVEAVEVVLQARLGVGKDLQDNTDRPAPTAVLDDPQESQVFIALP